MTKDFCTANGRLYENHTQCCMNIIHITMDVLVLGNIHYLCGMNQYKTILIVDDNPAILTAARICLDGVFERIITQTVPENIIMTLQQERVDVILLDMNFSLGVNSGQEGMKWLQAIHRRHPDIPIVLITAYADVRLAVRALKAGATDFVTKPWDNDGLIRTLKDAIDKSQEVIPLEQMETKHVRMVVDKCHGNMSKAAEMLGITRQTLYNKLKTHS